MTKSYGFQDYIYIYPQNFVYRKCSTESVYIGYHKKRGLWQCCQAEPVFPTFGSSIYLRILIFETKGISIEPLNELCLKNEKCLGTKAICSYFAVI